MILSEDERRQFTPRSFASIDRLNFQIYSCATICQDVFDVLPLLPSASVDLLFADPPYNLNKTFNQGSFATMPLLEYENWLDSWLRETMRLLKPTASVYICGDWRSSIAIHRVCAKYFTVRNRITWEREKGRGAETNWKNCSEDIWFCTVGRSYCFDVNSVKLKRRIIRLTRARTVVPRDGRRARTANTG